MSSSFRYVKDFEFPASAGFHGSSKGYACGGKVMKKAEGGDVSAGYTTNAEGQKLFVSRPATTTTTTATTTAAKTLSKKDQRRLDRQKRQAANMARREELPADNPGRKVLPATAGTGYKAATGTGIQGVQIDYRNVGLAAPKSKPRPATGTTTTATTTAAKTLSKKDQNRLDRQKRQAANMAKRDERRADSVALKTVQDKMKAAKDKASEAAGDKARAARKAEQTKRLGSGSSTSGITSANYKTGTSTGTSTGTTASAAMAKAHGGIAHKAMTKKSRGGVPAHSNAPMIKKAAGGKAAGFPTRDGMSYTPVVPYTGKKGSRR
jgi:hypothetical protein